MTQNHILGTFDEALATLRNNVLMMSSLTERSLDRAVTGLLQRDDDLCVLAIADDEEIDQLEKQVDKDGVDLLLRFQPVASDLRRVVSAMKLSSNLERMADQAVNIARKARKLNQHPALPEVGIDRADARPRDGDVQGQRRRLHPRRRGAGHDLEGARQGARRNERDARASSSSNGWRRIPSSCAAI